MKKLVMAVALMCVVSTSSFAGDMPTTGKTEPPQPPPTTSSTLLANVVSTIITLIR